MDRRQAIEPTIGHLKADHRMDRCCMRGATGDVLLAVLCAAGSNLRWPLPAIVRQGIRAVILRLRAWCGGNSVGGTAIVRQVLALSKSVNRAIVPPAIGNARYALVFG